MNTYTTGEQQLPVVAPAGDGDFVAIWSESDSFSTRNGLWGQRLSLCGDGIPDAGEACDDGNTTDDDCCASTCERLPFPGTCWNLAGVSVLRASARGTFQGVRVECHGSCQLPAESTVLLRDDSTFRASNTTLTCPTGQVIDFPDAVGRVRRKGQQRFVARPGNMSELRDAARACSRTKLNGIRTTYRLSGAGLSLSGKEVAHAQQTVQGLPVEIAVTTRFNGLQTNAGHEPTAPPGPKHVRICDSPLRVRCTRD